MIDAQKIIDLYGLEPLPGEGGYYRETYRSKEFIDRNSLPGRYSGDRAYYTSIYYLLTRETRSLIHRIKSDELFHFYSGDPVEILQLHPGGEGRISTLGGRLSDGVNFQQMVPKNVWLGLQLIGSGNYAFMGTTVSPGFELDDFELGIEKDLIREFPAFKEKIKELTG